MKKINTTILWIKRIVMSATAVVLFAAIQGGSTPPQGRMVDMTQDDAGLTLLWRGISNATYRVEQRTNLLAGEWDPLPLQVVSGETATWPIAYETDQASQFFRVQFPTPELTGSEPAFVPQAGGTTVYVTGNYFYEGDQIRVNGVLLTNVVFLSHNLLSGELPDLAPGLHDVDVLNSLNGTVFKALPDALEVAPSFERTLQGAPEWPLAGPASPRSVVPPRDPPSGQATGKRIHSPRSSGSGLPTGKRMHSPFRSSGNGGWGDPHENGVALRKSGNVLDDDSDDDGLADALDTDSDGDGLSDVYLHSGEVRQQSIDLAVPGRGLDFVWGRTYRSRTGVADSQGNRWTHSYDVRCVKNSDGDIEVFDGSGRKDVFRMQADGTYACPELFREGTLDAATGTFRLTFADTGYWEFCPFDAISPDSGKLDRIVDRNGNTITLNYGTTGKLATVVDDLGRIHTVAYTPDGQVASVTDASGRTVTYAYYGENDPDGCPGDLKSVTSPAVTGTSTGNDFPSGKTTTYTYTTGPAAETCSLLLSIVDARDQTAVTYAYDLDPASPTFTRCLSIQRGADAPTYITYLPQTPTPDNRFAAMRCIVNDPEGNVSERDFDLRNRCLSLTEFTGRAEPNQPVTATTNRPTDPLRPDDPASFKITWTWNDGGLCMSQTRPSGDRDEWVYQGDLDSATPPRFRANLRVARHVSTGDLDGDGDLDTIVRSFEHDPRFGSERCSARTGRNPQTGKEIKIAAKKVAKFKAGKALAETVKLLVPDVGGDNCPSKDNDCDGFVTRAMGPRGLERQNEFDANGNLVSSTSIVLDRTPPQMSFAYNIYGQVTAVTNALDANDQRRVDTFSYYTSGSQRGALQQKVIDAGASGLNHTTSYEYDARGNVTRCIDPRGTATEIEVNALNQTIVIATQGATLGERAALRCYYDANNNLVQVDRENRAPDGTLDATNPYWTTALFYDNLNRPIQTEQELSQSAQPSVMTNQFVYNANGNLISHLLPEAVSGANLDNVVAYAHDERGLLFSTACAPGTGLSTVDFFDYDANGNVKKISQSTADSFSESTFVHDRFGRVLQTVDAMGNATIHRYDANGNRIYTRVEGELIDLPGGTLNRTLSEETFTFDAFNRLTGHSASFFDPTENLSIGDGVADTEWTYAPNGQLISVTDDNGHTATSTYDSLGRRASATDPKGNTVSYTYDNNGNLLTEQTVDVSDVGGTHIFTRAFTYDALNRCISATDNVGNTVSNAYDSSHNLVKITDARGNERVFTIDGLGRVTDTVQYSGSEEDGVILSSAHVVYRNKRCVSSTDGNGNTTQFAYDALDRCVTITHPDGTVESQGWSPRSTLALYTNANGTTVTNTYDYLDRLVQRDIAVAEGVSDSTTFETLAYNGLGSLVSAENDSSVLSFAYDSLGNRIRAVQDGMETTSSYDGVGNRLALTCPDGRTIFTDHDVLGQPNAIRTRATAGESPITLATLSYEGLGRLAKIARANTINTRVFWNGDQNAPNAIDDFGWQQIARINHAKAGGGNVIDQRNSSYDRNQNERLRIMTTPWTSGGLLTENSYAYDGLNRLISSVRSNSPVGDSAQSYVLDANGNRLQVTNNGLTEAYVMDNTIPPGDAQMNQYTEAPSGAFTYDANGSRIASSSGSDQRVYRYDYANRLVQVDEQDAGGDLTAIATYRFSPAAAGRRLGKSTPVLSGGVPGVQTITYLYDYGIDQDCDGVDDDCNAPTRGGILQTYVDGALVRTFIASGISNPSGIIASINGETVLFHHSDNQGSLLALTDNKGDVLERFAYDDFGKPSFLDAEGQPRSTDEAVAALDSNPYAFLSQHWDVETGLYTGSGGPSTQMNKGELIDAIAKDAGYSQCRTYDPRTGRDLSRPYGSMIAGPVPPFAPPVIFLLGRLAPLHSGIETKHSHSAPQQTQRRRDGRPPELVHTVIVSGGGGQGGGKAQDHNSSRSNKTASLFGPDGGGNMGNITGTAKKVAKFKAGKALADELVN